MTPRLFNLGRLAIVLGCIYEIVAIPHKTRNPTITALVKGSQKHWWGKLATFLWLACWIHHFVEPKHFRK